MATEKLQTAFPSGNEETKGLTKREYFSSIALQGILSATGGSGSSPETLASAAVEFADALIAALNDRE